MAKTEFKVDIGGFLRSLDVTNLEVLRRAEVGVGKSMLQLKTDMITQRPTAPIDEGYLRGSTSIFVQNQRIPSPAESGEKIDKRVESHTISIKKTEIKGVIGVNVPYAARHHEVPANFKEESAGNKYLESKMANNKMTYKRIISNTIKRGD